MLGGKKSTIIGLDVGFSTIKVMEIDARKKEMPVKRFVAVPTGLTPMMSDEEKQERTTSLLQQLWKELGLKKRVVHSILPGKAVFYRPLKIPIVTGDRLEKLIRYEAKQQIPFPLDQILLDYHLFGGSGGELEGILIAVRRDTVQDHVKLLSRAGLRPDTIAESSICVYNGTRQIEREQDEVIGIVNIGATSTDIIIEHEHILKFRRSAPRAGNELTMALHNNLGRSFEECEDLKIRFGRLSTSLESRFDELPGEWAGEVSEEDVVSTLDQAFERVVTEIRRSIDFYISQPDGMAVSRLLISGGSASLPGAVEFLEDRLGIPVEKVDPAQCSQINLGETLTPETENTALVLSGIAEPPDAEHYVSMNFIPETIQQRKEFEKKKGYIFVQAVFIVLLVGLVYMLLRKEVMLREAVYKDIEAVINQDETVIGKEFKDAIERKEEMGKRFIRLGEIADRRGKVMHNLLEVVRISPILVSITSINVEHNDVLIKGRASDDAVVKDFMDEIRLSPFFGEMTNKTPQGSGDAFVFNITNIREPNEDELKFYQMVRPVRQTDLPTLKNFRFNKQRKAIFRFYETDRDEELFSQCTKALELLVNSEIEYSSVLFTIFNVRNIQTRFVEIEDKDTVQQIYYGEREFADVFDELWSQYLEERFGTS